MSNTRSDQLVANTPAHYLEAAWAHARDFLASHGSVPDVMVLGIYADQDIQFIFPSGQDRAAFGRACQQEASNTNADVAMFISQCTMAENESTESSPIIMVAYRERGGPVRIQYCHLSQDDGTNWNLGPVSAMVGQHSVEFLDDVFSGTVTH